MVLIPPTVTDAQEGFSLDVIGPDASVVVFILNDTVPPVTTDVQIDGVNCTQVLVVSGESQSLQAWVLDGVDPGTVAITITGDQTHVYGVALKGSGGFDSAAGAQGFGIDTPTLAASGTYLQRVVGMATLLPSIGPQIFADHGQFLYRNSPDFNVHIHQSQGGATQTWEIDFGDGSELWTVGVVLFNGVDVDFTPSPCASLYIETDLIPGLSEGDTTDPYPIPGFGTADTEPWGGGADPRPEVSPFPEGFYYHETGAPGTNGPWIEQHNDVPFAGFPGAFHRQLIQNQFADDTPPELYEYLGMILGTSPAHDQTKGHWTLFSVMWCSSQTENTANPDEETFLDRDQYPYIREWFGSDSSWGLAYYSRDGQFYIALHSGYDVENFLELPVDLDTWIYIEARQDATTLYLRVNDTEINRPAVIDDAVDDWDNSLQWGDFDHHAGWALLQICDTLLHCSQRELRRWEIQEKYGFPLSPMEDCSGDPEEVESIVLPRRARMAQIIG